MTTRFTRTDGGNGHTGKRRRLDRNAGRVIEVGIQTVHAFVDRFTIDSSMAAYAKGEIGILPAPGPGGYDVLKAEPAFTLVNRRGHDAPLVMTAINGLDRRAAKRYPNDPEMVRLVIRAMIQTIGTPLENAPRIDSSLKPAVALGVAGLATLAAVDASAGAGAVYDVPELRAGVTGSERGGVPSTKVTLILRNRNSEQVARRLNKLASAINEDGELWKRAMEGYREPALVWHNAVRALTDNAIKDGLMFVYRCIEAGLLRVDETGGGAGRRVPVELLGVGGATLSASETTARLADCLRFTQPTDSLVGTLASSAVAQYGMLKHTYTNSLFYTGDSATGMANARYEFGAEKDPVTGAMSFKGRYDNHIVSTTRHGAMLSAQLNAPTRAAAAYDTVACDEGRFSAGRFMTGSSQAGSGAAMLSYGAHA